MVLLKGKPSSLEDRQAQVEISLSTSSPTISLSGPEDPNKPFCLVLTVRITASSRPGRPITICASDTVLDTRPPDIDIMAVGAFEPLQCTTDPQKTISLGNWRPNIRHPDPSPDMKERDWLKWLTVPVEEGSVQITHDLPLSRMFKYESTLKPQDIKPGESYRVRMNPGHVGTMWWCWGDLEGDLREKKFSQWRRGWDGWNFGVEKPNPDVIEKEGWVLGEDLDRLWFEDTTSNGIVIQFVE